MSEQKYGAIAYLDAYQGLYNLGDDIQTIAARGLLPRVDQYIEREALDSFVSGEDVPIQVVLNGWFSHAPNRWPPSNDIQPLITSFHVTRNAGLSGWPLAASEVLLTGDNLAYLRRFAPIGCRDLDTLEQCRAAEVEAYFSGCLTLTLQRPEIDRDKQLIVLNDLPMTVLEQVDSQTEKNIVLTKHYRFGASDPAQRFGIAEDLLKLYARASCVLTSRLHCALPCLAFGTPVLLIDLALDQYRFSGLSDLLQHVSLQDFLEGGVQFDVNAPPAARTDHVPLAEALTRSVQKFIERRSGPAS